LLRWEERAVLKKLLVNALRFTAFYQVVEKVGFPRLVKNAPMQGSRNPPEVRRTSMVRRNDEVRGKRSRWAFFNSLLAF
jgi:hypothetical protein